MQVDYNLVFLMQDCRACPLGEQRAQHALAGEGGGRGGTVRFAYADPPYLGQGSRLYGDHPEAAEFDTIEGHARLIARLVSEYSDGWALSASSPSLRLILPLCPADVRVAAWVKPFSAFKRGVRPAYAWEPVIFRGGRNPPWQKHLPPEKGGKQTTPKDFFSHVIMLKKGLTGAKPPAFCDWVMDLLNVAPEDSIDDLFPGTGIFTERARARVGTVKEVQ